MADVIKQFQSTLPARGATRWRCLPRLEKIDFNPRSPHGERPDEIEVHEPPKVISIHAPRTGSDKVRDFLCKKSRNFNPRSPHGERQLLFEQCGCCRDISIHAPRTGSDIRRLQIYPLPSRFQSTLPARGATAQKYSEILPKRFQSTLPARGATLDSLQQNWAT